MAPATLEQALGEARQLGVDRFDAEILLTLACGISRSRLIAWPQTPLGSEQLQCYRHWIRRRAAGEPLAYLTGRQGFMDIEVEVSPAVLIPRPETELLVTTALELHHRGPATVLELGTGSAAIALALAHARQDWRVVATDRSLLALAMARRNVERLAPNRVQLLCCDWFEGLAHTAFDLIIANPPYVAAGDPELESEVARYEPATALYAADDGMADLAKLMHSAPTRLRPGGWLLLEHGHRQGAAVRQGMRAAGLEAIDTCRDASHHERVTIARRRP